MVASVLLDQARQAAKLLEGALGLAGSNLRCGKASKQDRIYDQHGIGTFVLVFPPIPGAISVCCAAACPPLQHCHEGGARMLRAHDVQPCGSGIAHGGEAVSIGGSHHGGEQPQRIGTALIEQRPRFHLRGQ